VGSGGGALQRHFCTIRSRAEFKAVSEGKCNFESASQHPASHRCVRSMCGIHVVVAGVPHTVALFDTFLAQKRAQTDETASNIEKQHIATSSRNDLALARRGPDGNGTVKLASCGCGCVAVTVQNSVLQLRGEEKIRVPLHRKDTKNVIAFNGEIFGSTGGEAPAESDTIWLLTRLDAADGDATMITNTFSSLRGPWCAVYWHHTTRHLWFAKDVLGRRSLLIGFSSARKGLVSIASVAPLEARQSGEEWIDCPPGIYSIDYSSLSFECKQSMESRINWKHHAWSDKLSSTLFFLRRTMPARNGNLADDRFCEQSVQGNTLHVLWRLLDRSVRCRVTQCNIPSRLGNCQHTEFDDAFVGVLFSGGLDCTLLSALIHRNLRIEESVDLYSVCFDDGNSPDRRAARNAVAELQRVCAGRTWRLIEINVSKSELKARRHHIESLIYPSGSDMDFNIGAALWFAARGIGRVTSAGSQKCFKTTIYQSRSRIIFSGMGADELCGGYSRHRTIFKSFGEEALEESLRSDILNLWRRNLGRDDRILSDHGKETRYPYLDEEFICQILRSPLRDIVDLSLSPGVGDKKCLRRLAKHLGLSFTAHQRKRAIQFGSRVRIHECNDEMIHASPL